MKTKFCADWAMYDQALGDESETFQELLNLFPKKDCGYVLDWGGGCANKSKAVIENKRFKIINMDPNIGSLKMSPNGVLPVLGVGQYLPFEESSFHGVHISAALHH